MVAATLVESVSARQRCFIGDRVDVWEWAVQIKVGDIERWNPRHHIVLKVDDGVVLYLGINGVDAQQYELVLERLK